MIASIDLHLFFIRNLRTVVTAPSEHSILKTCYDQISKLNKNNDYKCTIKNDLKR